MSNWTKCRNYILCVDSRKEEYLFLIDRSAKKVCQIDDAVFQNSNNNKKRPAKIESNEKQLKYDIAFSQSFCAHTFKRVSVARFSLVSNEKCLIKYSQIASSAAAAKKVTPSHNKVMSHTRVLLFFAHRWRYHYLHSIHLTNDIWERSSCYFFFQSPSLSFQCVNELKLPCYSEAENHFEYVRKLCLSAGMTENAYNKVKMSVCVCNIKSKWYDLCLLACIHIIWIKIRCEEWERGKVKFK